MNPRDRTTPPTSSEQKPLARVLAMERTAAERPNDDLVRAGATVREVMLDVLASTTDEQAAADELVKAVRAKPTRWAFARLIQED